MQLHRTAQHIYKSIFFTLCALILSACIETDIPTQADNITFDNFTLPSEDITLFVGNTYTLKMEGPGYDAIKKDLSLQSVTGIYTIVDGLKVVAIATGLDILKITYVPTGEYKLLTVKVQDVNITSFSFTPAVSTIVAGDSTTIDIETSPALPDTDSDTGPNIVWNTDISITWDKSVKKFRLNPIEAGTFTITGSYGGHSNSANITVTDAEVRSIEWHKLNATDMPVNSSSYGLLLSNYSDGFLAVNEETIMCRSSDPAIAQIFNPPEENGFLIKSYATGDVVFTCDYPGLASATHNLEITKSLLTSWRVDDNNDIGETLCSSAKCSLAHFHKASDGAINALIEEPGDTFRLMSTTNHLSTLSYVRSLTKPPEAIKKSMYNNAPTFSYGDRGMISINYSHIDSESSQRVTEKQLYLLKTDQSNTNQSIGFYSTPIDSNALNIENTYTSLMSGIIHAVVSDDNGGDNTPDDETSFYEPDYWSRLWLNQTSTALSPVNSLNLGYVDLVNEINSSSYKWGPQYSTSISFNASSSVLTQKFLGGYTNFGERDVDLSVCDITGSNLPSDRIFIRQVAYPSQSTLILCIGNTSAHLFLYDDGSTSSDALTYYSTTLPQGWIKPESLSGLKYMGIDTPSDTFGGRGNPVMATYLGYSGTDSTKTHFALIFDNDSLQAIMPKAEIGLNNVPYVTSATLGWPTHVLFNYVATNTSRELWTPYGTLGTRSDMAVWSMNLGYAPFEQATALPYTYNVSGKKAQGLLLFAPGDADSLTYGVLQTYYSNPALLK